MIREAQTQRCGMEIVRQPAHALSSADRGVAVEGEERFLRLRPVDGTRTTAPGLRGQAGAFAEAVGDGEMSPKLDSHRALADRFLESGGPRGQRRDGVAGAGLMASRRYPSFGSTPRRVSSLVSFGASSVGGPPLPSANCFAGPIMRALACSKVSDFVTGSGFGDIQPLPSTGFPSAPQRLLGTL